MKIKFVDLKVQYDGIKHEIDDAMARVVADTAFIGGRYVSQFEEAFAAYCNAQYCVGVGNGTDAIYIALRGLGIGKGDEVITVANSFIATSEAISMTGARVVFVDCESDTYNIDVGLIEKAISARTKAIVPVHLYGHPADMEQLQVMAKEKGLLLIEDAAQAHGAEINGQRVGTFGDVACFSFYPGKNLGAYGDGGAIITNNEALAIKCRMIANHGRTKKYDHEFEGINSRLDGLQAAILNVKLKHLEEWTEKRRFIASIYKNILKDSDIIIPIENNGYRHVYHLYVIRVKNRQAVQNYLSEKGVDTGIHYPIALPHLQAYRYLGHTENDFPVATQYAREILSLRMYPELSQTEAEGVCKLLKEAITNV